MGQRVNIQYSVDLRDLDAEVKGLLNKALADLCDVVQKNDFQGCDRISLQMIKGIDELRQRLADIDLRLSDVSEICTGYLQFETKRQDAQAPSPPPAPVDPLDNQLGDISELKQTLQNFKDSLPTE